MRKNLRILKFAFVFLATCTLPFVLLFICSLVPRTNDKSAPPPVAYIHDISLSDFGKKIAFKSTEGLWWLNAQSETGIIDIENKELLTLSLPEGQVTEIKLDHDGNNALVATQEGGHYCIRKVDLKTSAAPALFCQDNPVFCPVYTPDQKSILYVSSPINPSPQVKNKLGFQQIFLRHLEEEKALKPAALSEIVFYSVSCPTIAADKILFSIMGPRPSMPEKTSEFDMYTVQWPIALTTSSEDDIAERLRPYLLQGKQSFEGPVASADGHYIGFYIFDRSSYTTQRGFYDTEKASFTPVSLPASGGDNANYSSTLTLDRAGTTAVYFTDNNKSVVRYVISEKTSEVIDVSAYATRQLALISR